MRPHSAKKLLVPSGVASQDFVLFHSKFNIGEMGAEPHEFGHDIQLRGSTLWKMKTMEFNNPKWF